MQKLNGIVEESKLEILRNGVKIEDYITSPAKVRFLSYDKVNNQSTIEIVIHEGKNRQVRKMMEAIGKKIIELERSKIGSINVQNLKQGSWRYLNQEEVDKLIK